MAFRALTPLKLLTMQFNKFFTDVGRQISDGVLPVDKNAEDYVVSGTLPPYAKPHPYFASKP